MTHVPDAGTISKVSGRDAPPYRGLFPPEGDGLRAALPVPFRSSRWGFFRRGEGPLAQERTEKDI